MDHRNTIHTNHFEKRDGDKMENKKDCPLKSGLKCSVLAAKKATKGIINIIRDGRCYAEMCPAVDRLAHNNPWDGFGRCSGYNPDEFSLKSIKRSVALKSSCLEN